MSLFFQKPNMLKIELNEENFFTLTGCSLPLKLVLGCTGVYPFYSFTELRDNPRLHVIFVLTDLLQVNIVTDAVELERRFDFDNQIVRNELFTLSIDKETGMGLIAFSSQLDYLMIAGVERMECKAAGTYGIRKIFSGYFVWPSYGWKPLPDGEKVYKNVLSRFGIDHEKFPTPNDLIRCEELITFTSELENQELTMTGRDIWLIYGESIEAYFDLTPNDDCMQRYKDYILYKQAKLNLILQAHNNEVNQLTENELKNVKHLLEFLNKRIQLLF
ncbi:hypothetical protein [Chitinophaga agri]|uniref:Uncharacterized protein n=1 Tax=Chitinophaga agri TaxID=2703787 RepID=A0A6B9ZFK5_9BACT|nr:hypothetical protein [Chitinophaga agri]QHS61168.1 hypothetical protein GWR21_16655 [Chitinophaga agri]